MLVKNFRVWHSSLECSRIWTRQRSFLYNETGKIMGKRRNIVVISMLLSLYGTCFAGWQMDEFLISFWGGPENPSQAAAIRRAHFTTVMCRLSYLDLCRDAGLKAILFDISPSQARRLRAEDSVWGYSLKDEPENHEFPRIARLAKSLRRADPGHPVYVNLGWKADPDLFVRTVKPQILSFDDYRWWWKEDFLPLLDKYRRISLEEDLPLLFWVEANTGPDSEAGPGAVYPADNMARIRSSVFTALAYGARGIQWFVDRLIFDGSRLTHAGEDVALVNAELKNLGPVLMKLRSSEVYHCGSGQVPRGARSLPRDFWVQTSTPEGLIGLFKDSAGRDYIMAVNRGTEHTRQARLRFKTPVSRAQLLDKKSGRWIDLSLEQISTAGREAEDLSPQPTVLVEIRFPLSPGDGELIRIDE